MLPLLRSAVAPHQPEPLELIRGDSGLFESITNEGAVPGCGSDLEQQSLDAAALHDLDELTGGGAGAAVPVLENRPVVLGGEAFLT
jgi:hypothetical protein